MTRDHYQALESDEEMEIIVCKDQQISSSVTVLITSMTVDNATVSGLPLPSIPENDPNSPNRASKATVLSYSHAAVSCILLASLVYCG